MKTTSKAIALVLFCLSASTYAAPTSTNENLVELSTTASVEVAPDWLSFTLTATKESSDSNDAQRQLRLAVDTALAEVRKNAVPSAVEVKTGQFTLQPNYGRDNKIVSWRGYAELIVEGKDMQKLANLVGRLNTMVVTNSSFSISTDTRLKYEAQAQAQAITQFKTKATDIAQGFGFSSYSIRNVQVGYTGGMAPMPRMMAARAPMSAMSMSSESMPVEAGKSTVQVTVSGTVALK